MDDPTPPVSACYDLASPAPRGPGGNELRRRLARAWARLEAAIPYSPDWDAAMAEIEEIEGCLAEAGTTDLGTTPGAVSGIDAAPAA